MNDHTLSQVGEWIEALEWVLEANADPESENLLAAFLRRLGGNAQADNN